MKNKKVLNKKISTEIGVGVVLLIAIVIGGAFYLRSKKENIKILSNNSVPTANPANKYTDTDYGFSLNLPYPIDKYVINISPNTITRFSFWLPATNKKFIEYTGHKFTDVFSILVYPKNKLDTIRNECQKNTGVYLKHECVLIDEQQLAENNMYSFYYLRGGVNMGAYPQALDEREYAISEAAAKNLRAQMWTLNFDPNAWHKLVDMKYGYEIEYPNNWRADNEANIQNINSYDQGLVSIFHESGTMEDGKRGSILFGKYGIYNNSLTDSIDGNVGLLNSKVSIIGSKSSYKEVKIEGGRAFINQMQSTIASNEREIFIVGKNVIFNGNIEISSNEVSPQELNEFSDILSHFKFLQ